MKELQNWIDHHYSKIREDLFNFLRFKTISADPSLKEEHQKCSEWLVRYFHQMGFSSEVIPTPFLPLVFAEMKSKRPNAPTLLIYGHYDVQPVDPIELWNSDPFEPIEKDGKIFARGAQDDKGQIFFAIAALKMMLEKKMSLPVNVKFLIEGEEENGSEGLTSVLPKIKDKLQADDLLVVDFDIIDEKTPAINLGARGIVTMEATLRGSNTDLHSGAFGGIAYNPNRAAAELIAQFWDANGRVTVPHFYDGVIEVPSQEKKSFYSPDMKFIQEAGIQALGGEKGLSSQEASWMRPTLEINGLSGGYTGPGFKTVIPAETKMKISCRLVPNQNPQKVAEHIKEFLQRKVKKGIDIRVDIQHGAPSYRGNPNSKLARATERAYSEVFGTSCQKVLAGGSIPVVAEMIHALHPEVVGIGCGLVGDNIHAPNEHFGVDRLKKGIMVVVQTINHLAAV